MNGENPENFEFKENSNTKLKNEIDEYFNYDFKRLVIHGGIKWKIFEHLKAGFFRQFRNLCVFLMITLCSIGGKKKL